MACHHWLSAARASGRPVFPARFTQDPETGKWSKTTKVVWHDLTTERALLNYPTDYILKFRGCGIVMGGGIHAIDLDLHKSNYAGLPEPLPETRVHITANGGEHHFFHDHLELRSTNGLYAGVDTRGEGGCVFFGEPYTVANRVPWDQIPPLPGWLKHDIWERNRSAGVVSGFGEPDAVDLDTMRERIERRVRLFPDSLLARRWHGDTSGLHDTSASAMDMSTASILAKIGYSYSEIAWTLRELFDFGRSAKYGMDAENVWRQQKRAAATAVQREGNRNG